MTVVKKLVISTELKQDRRGEKGVLRTFKRIKQAAAIAAGAFAAKKVITGFFNLADGVATVGDRLAKTSKNLGINIQALQEIEFLLERAGGNAQDAEKSLTRLAQSAFDASRGSKTAVDAFKALGIEEDELKKISKDLPSLFARILTGIEQEKDQVKSLAAARLLLGRASKSIVVVAKQGTKENNKQIERLRKLGTLSKKTAEASEKFKDQQRDLQQSILGVQSSIAEKLFPVFDQLIEKTITWVGENDKFIKQGLAGDIAEIAKGMATLALLTGKAAGAVLDLGKWLGETSSDVAQLLGITGNDIQVGGTTDASEGMKRVLQKRKDLIEKNAKEIEQIQKRLTPSGGGRFSVPGGLGEEIRRVKPAAIPVTGTRPAEAVQSSVTNNIQNDVVISGVRDPAAAGRIAADRIKMRASVAQG